MDSFEFWINLIWAAGIIIVPAVVIIAFLTWGISVLYEKCRMKFIIAGTIRRESIVGISDAAIADEVKELRRGFDWRAADRTEICDGQFSGDLDGPGSSGSGDDRGTDGKGLGQGE